MELVRNYVKENLMMLICGAVLFGIVFLGSLANMRVDYTSSKIAESTVNYDLNA